jgi:hypothetical protein
MSDTNTEPSKFLSSLESATRSDTFFLLATFTLLVDSALIYIHGYGLIYQVQHPDEIKLSFGLELYLLFVAFSFVMAIVMKFITPFTSEIVLLFWHIKNLISDGFRSLGVRSREDSEPTPRRYGCVILLTSKR